MTQLNVNQSSLADHFEKKVIYEPNYYQEKYLSEDVEFNAKLGNLVDAQKVINEASVVNSARNKVIKKRALFVIAAIVGPIATLLILVGTIALCVVLDPICFPIALLTCFIGAALTALTGLGSFNAALIASGTINHSKKESAAMNNKSIKALKSAQEQFNALKTDMNEFIKNELPHATATELQSLEAHFLKQVENRKIS